MALSSFACMMPVAGATTTGSPQKSWYGFRTPSMAVYVRPACRSMPSPRRAFRYILRPIRPWLFCRQGSGVVDAPKLRKLFLLCIWQCGTNPLFLLRQHTGSRGRVARQRSAKPPTAVRIRSRPPVIQPPHDEGVFFMLNCRTFLPTPVEFFS